MAFKGILPFPTLPHDVLRMILEYAAKEDRKSALNLVLVSHLVQRWIDWILYAVVLLHRQSTTRTFLRTIETSKTKSRAFFATHVKSLCVSYDIYNEPTIRIISACRGVTSLTFWAVPVTQVTHISAHPGKTLTNGGLVAALTPLRPRRLSVLLNDASGSSQPKFHLPFFERITHFAVVNKWEDWTRWTGFDLLPCLTHLSFDLRIGPRLLDVNKARAVARALNNVLSSCSRLRVCVLLLLFDSQPMFTMEMIMKQMIKTNPKLVFLRDTEPFRDREAHSKREAKIWEYAEGTAVRQRLGAGHSFSEI